ncbi:MAG: hypothetical protein QM713_10840 [Arachnia sp.]
MTTNAPLPDAPEALRDGLRRTADDVDFAVPDLLPRARAARLRRRLGVAAVCVAGVVAGAVIIPGQLAATRTVPAEPGPASTHAPVPTPSPTAGPTASADGMLAPDEIVRRCLPTLGASVARYGPAPADLHVARTRGYREGDLVRLVSDSGWDPSALCSIPAAGASQPTAWADLLGSSGTIVPQLEACSELYTRPDGGYDTVDVRGADVVSFSAAGPLVDVLVATGGERYECGWNVRSDGTIEFFGSAEPVGDPPAGSPNPTVRMPYATWDPASDEATIVVWGDTPPGTDSIEVEGLDDNSMSFYSERGVFRVFAWPRATGTAERWTSAPFSVVAYDADGEEIQRITPNTQHETP